MEKQTERKKDNKLASQLDKKLTWATLQNLKPQFIHGHWFSRLWRVCTDLCKLGLISMECEWVQHSSLLCPTSQLFLTCLVSSWNLEIQKVIDHNLNAFLCYWWILSQWTSITNIYQYQVFINFFYLFSIKFLKVYVCIMSKLYT